jgi:hypothetical protein
MSGGIWMKTHRKYRAMEEICRERAKKWIYMEEKDSAQ